MTSKLAVFTTNVREAEAVVAALNKRDPNAWEQRGDEVHYVGSNDPTGPAVTALRAKVEGALAMLNHMDDIFAGKHGQPVTKD